ncbi:BZIP-type transcription factor [Apiospora phragmitis]|uniref:BZIP-type transcription factor n=1 Tax=Apiospora phragmitis TaxID=2905665 RepID=A0ABR1WQU1_9PEZI
MGDRLFRIFNPNAPKEDAAIKRRRQLRQAQKTYRDRKEIYLKSLEEDLKQSRIREANLLREREQMQRIIDDLTQQRSSQSADDVFTPVSVAKDSPEPSQDGGTRYSHAPEGVNQRLGELGLQQCLTSQQPSQRASPATAILNSHGDDDTRIGDADEVEVGMDFVLTLEGPCLGHLAGDPHDAHAPTGHALAVSSQLLCVAPTTPTAPHDPPPGRRLACPPPGSGLAPRDLLDNLLRLSYSLCSDGELTPAQAWRYIRCQPGVALLRVGALRRLAEQLLRDGKCHGYGTVLQTDKFRAAFMEILAAD